MPTTFGELHLSKRNSELLQPSTPATAQPLACAEPTKKLTINDVEFKIESALAVLREHQSLKRSLEAAIAQVAKLIANDLQTIDSLKQQRN